MWGNTMKTGLAVAVAAGLTSLASVSSVQAFEKDTKPPEIPTCDHKIGTLAVTEPEKRWWEALNL